MQCIAMYTTSATSARWGSERLGIFGTSREARRFIRNLEPLYIERATRSKNFVLAWVRPSASTPLYIWNSPTVTALSGGSLLARVYLREGRGRLTHLHDAPIEGEY